MTIELIVGIIRYSHKAFLESKNIIQFVFNLIKTPMLCYVTDGSRRYESAGNVDLFISLQEKYSNIQTLTNA